MQTNPSRATLPFSGPRTQEAIFFCLTHPRARYQTPRDHPTAAAPNPRKLAGIASPNLSCHAFPFQLKLKGVAYTLPILSPVFCLLVSFPRAPVCHAVPPVSRTCEYNTFCCPEPLICLLLWLHLTDHLINECKTVGI